jgi:hypothetical protein
LRFGQSLPREDPSAQAGHLLDVHASTVPAGEDAMVAAEDSRREPSWFCTGDVGIVDVPNADSLGVLKGTFQSKLGGNLGQIGSDLVAVHGLSGESSN